MIAVAYFINNLNAKSFYTCECEYFYSHAETIVTFLTYYHSPMDLDFFLLIKTDQITLLPFTRLTELFSCLFIF